MSEVIDKPSEKPLVIPAEKSYSKRGEEVPAAQPMNLVQALSVAAADPRVDVAKVERLWAMLKDQQDREARNAFVAAMSAFKAKVPEIIKRKAVNIPGGAAFTHAELGTVCDAVIPALSEHGFAHRWEVTQAEGLITVSCILSHEQGHETRTTLQGKPDDSGKKNAIQQVGSTVTYLERYTLMAATGLAAKGMDNDGNGAGSAGAGLPEKKVADYLASIGEAADEESLKRSFANAWNAAADVKDKQAQRDFTEARDKRRAELKRGGR